MSKGPENTFIGSVHKHLPVGLYRMKNHNEYNAGIADCWYDGPTDLWVEYKFLALPKRDSTPVCLVGGKNPMLSALQQKWLRDRHANGRSVWVILGTPDGGAVYMFPQHWEASWLTSQVREDLLTRKQIADMIVHQVNHG